MQFSTLYIFLIDFRCCVFISHLICSSLMVWPWSGSPRLELTLKEYAEIGGTIPDDEEKKSDLLNILRGALRESFLWRATDLGPYTRFRDMVRFQTARSLLQQQRLPLHRVEELPLLRDLSHADDEVDFKTMTWDDLIAYVKKNGSNP